MNIWAAKLMKIDFKNQIIVTIELKQRTSLFCVFSCLLSKYISKYKKKSPFFLSFGAVQLGPIVND